MMKKAQSQIITTVLIILLVLAAVVIVWQVVRTTVTEGTDTLTERTACIGLSLDVTDVSVAVDVLTVKVTRGSGGPDDDNPLGLVLLVDGATVDYDGADQVPKQLESKTLVHIGAVDEYAGVVPGKVEVGGKIGNVACDYLACEGTAC